MVKEKFKSTVANINSYLLSFQNGDLVANQLIVQHNLRVEFPQVVVYDENNKMALPDDIAWLDEDRVALDLTSFTPIAGIWHTRIIKD